MMEAAVLLMDARIADQGVETAASVSPENR